MAIIAVHGKGGKPGIGRALGNRYDALSRRNVGGKGSLYWGRIIGTFIGAVVGVLLVSPVLKIFAVATGYFLGQQFDRGFAAHNTAFDELGKGPNRLSEEYVRALFMCIGHLAKTDGRVSEDEIRSTRLVMHQLNLSPAQVRYTQMVHPMMTFPRRLLIQRTRARRRMRRSTRRPTTSPPWT